jgi:hypothetical protein
MLVGVEAILAVAELWAQAFDEFGAEVYEYIDAHPWVICDTRWYGTGRGSAVGVEIRQADAYELKGGKGIESIPKPNVVTLARESTATAGLRIVDACNFPASACREATAAGLRVHPPGQTRSKLVPFPFKACARRPGLPFSPCGPRCRSRSRKACSACNRAAGRRGVMSPACRQTASRPGGAERRSAMSRPERAQAASQLTGLSRERVYGVAAVASMIGVSAAMLRNWEERYAVVSPSPAPGHGGALRRGADPREAPGGEAGEAS